MIVCHFCLNWPSFRNLNWNGPGLHWFHGLENLLIYVGDLNWFFTHREALCILQNALYFINHEIVNDASNDPCRHGTLQIGCLLPFSYSFPFSLFANILYVCCRFWIPCHKPTIILRNARLCRSVWKVLARLEGQLLWNVRREWISTSKVFCN